jgi:serine phosphatase RsbU (regulator of sigma subunit)
VPPGGALVFCSDGLFEGTDPRDNAYGYDRPRELLRALGDRSAAEILEALFAGWRKHLATDGPPADDTTVLVVKRKNS